MPGVLRLCTAGNVDDGKSTLIGRLLYDSRSVYDDHVAAVTRASRHTPSLPIDFSLFTDGLRAEREQGITIDVAYRYFSTRRRRFILADTPGHTQYTRNMATGASTSDLAVLLVDGRHGVREQTRAHVRIAALLGIRHFVLAVNKMDLVGFAESRYEEIRGDVAQELGDATIQAVPISALDGDNVVARSDRTPWYSGPSLLEYLETVDVETETSNRPFRFPVQRVIHSGDFRGYAGQITAGRIRPGDAVGVWPAGGHAVVTRLVTWDGDLSVARAPQSVVVELDRPLDISRGDLLAGSPPTVASRFDADVVWMDETPLASDRTYVLKHRTGSCTAEVSRALALNEVGRVTITASRPLVVGRYQDDRALGSFLLIDPASCFTSGAGLVAEAHVTAQTSPVLNVASRLAYLARNAASQDDAELVVQEVIETWMR